MLDEIVGKVLALSQPRVGLELQWELTGDDDDLRWLVELHVLVEEPGPEHSQYSSIEVHAFEGEELDSRREAIRLTKAVAERVRLPILAVPDLEQLGGHGGSNWLRAHPAEASVGYEVGWEAAWWSLDGRRSDASGIATVAAPSGDEACWSLVGQLENFPVRPLDVRTSWRTCHRNQSFGAEYPTTMPSIETMRMIAIENLCNPSRTTRAILALAPTASDLDVMVAFEHAFGGWKLDVYYPLVRWRKRELGDAALDAALDKCIALSWRRWRGPMLLLEARRRNYVPQLLRLMGGGNLDRIMMLREAFQMSLGDAKQYLDSALDSRNDEQLNSRVRTADS